MSVIFLICLVWRVRFVKLVNTFANYFMHSYCLLRLEGKLIVQIMECCFWNITTSISVIFWTHSPRSTFVATIRPWWVSSFWLPSLEDLFFLDKSLITLLWTIPKAPCPSSSMFVTRSGGTSSNVNSDPLYTEKENCSLSRGTSLSI